jgi:hypothetical protein
MPTGNEVLNTILDRLLKMTPEAAWEIINKNQGSDFGDLLQYAGVFEAGEIEQKIFEIPFSDAHIDLPEIAWCQDLTSAFDLSMASIATEAIKQNLKTNWQESSIALLEAFKNYLVVDFNIINPNQAPTIQGPVVISIESQNLSDQEFDIAEATEWLKVS